ncbi:outer membrane lipoprotein-sorting protein [Marispirochaeta aestuarii]|uniref:outer membrane lipoprotein-sorting protein n=1 Tax=Marispirochaeta aestuarii TaxID=1963862 RepID=UPI0029C78DA5|nr:outer membrane lipoprotein-sorting protein [Marispirochaeta aestuarii]
MKKLNLCKNPAALVSLLLMSSVNLFPQSLSGEDIMRRVDERYTGDTQKNTTTITLINKRGNSRVREIISYTKDYGDTEKNVMVFTEPRDVAGVGYLAYSYDELGKDDDTWLFLPAMKRSRRISGSSRNDYFMGTDFTYDDMGDRKVEEDTHALKGEEQINGISCWIIESVPKEPGYIYSRRVTWIRQDVLIAVKVEYYDRQEELQKILRTSDITEIDGIWTVRRMEMDNIQNEHRTILEFKNIQYNLPVEDSFFSVATLERGRIR